MAYSSMNNTSIPIAKTKLALLYSFVFLLLFSSLIAIGGFRVYAEAGPTVSVTPASTNLGTTVSVAVNTSAPGTYTVVVTKPDGTNQSQVNYVIDSASGEVQTYGNASIGFKTLIDQVGKYSVVLEQNGTKISETSFSAINQLIVELKIVNNGATTNPCFPDYTFSRGDSITVLVLIRYASTGKYVNGALDRNMTAKFSLPNGTWINAAYAAREAAWTHCFTIDWNYYAGAWKINATASDPYGNRGIYGNFLEVTYQVTPAPLTISSKVTNHATGQNATSSLANGETLDLSAQVQYLPPLGPNQREGPEDYTGSLNATRGGIVTALLGWGFYNQTSGKFGGNGSNAGGLEANIPLNYNASSGLWTASYKVPNSLPSENYTVVILAKDSASPANTGISVLSLLPSPSQIVAQSGINLELAGGVAIAVLIVGLLIGSLFSRKKRTASLPTPTVGA